MIQLIKADFYRLFKKPSFWVVCAICILFGLSIPFFAMKLQEMATMLGVSGSEQSNNVANFIRVFSSLHIIFLSTYFVIEFSVDDFKTRTIQNAICIGNRRELIFASKAIVSVLATWGCWFVTVLCCGLLGLCLFGAGSFDASKELLCYLNTLILFIPLTVMAVSLGFCFKRSSSTLIFSYCLLFLTSNFMSLFSKLLYCIQHRDVSLFDVFSGQFEDMIHLDHSLPSYYLEMTASASLTGNDFGMSVLWAFVWTVCFSALAILLFRRSEIK